MNGRKAKVLRSICFDRGLFDQNSEKLVATDPVFKEATIYSAQRKLYLRAKALWSRTGKAGRSGLLSSTRSAARFVNEMLLTKLM